MVTRAQGGSSRLNGQIEIMHNRRLLFDDGAGVNEALNEVDEYGNGITVRSTYYLHMFNSKYEKSMQR